MESRESLISVEGRSDVQVVRLLPKHILEPEQIADIGRDLKNLIDDGTTKMVLDFSEVLYLSSGTLGMLVNIRKLIEANKGSVKLCAIKPLLSEIFQITRLGGVFSVYPTVEDAVASFG